MIICRLFDTFLQHNNKWIGNGDFDIFHISHNNDNGGNEDLLVGNKISDNMVSRRLDDPSSASKSTAIWQWHSILLLLVVFVVCCQLGTCLGGGIYDNSTYDVTCLGRAPSLCHKTVHIDR
jgi:hypothetical protein